MNGRSIISRREALRLGVASGVALSVYSLRTASAQAAEPVAGGSLVVAMSGAGAKQTLDPHFQVSGIEFVTATNIYDRLAERLDGEINYRLATAMTPNAEATEWTITLRTGVRWHDGDPFTARDVLYTWKRMVKDKTGDSASLSTIDLDKVTIVNDHELRVPTVSPMADLPVLFVTDQTQIIKDGTTEFNPANGTGPFKLESFVPGREFVLVKNQDYWESGLPYLDKVTVQSIDDPNSRVNAIIGGQVDIASGVPVTQGRAYAPPNTDLSKPAVLDTPMGLKLVNSAGTLTVPFVMNTKMAPFDNADVRKAFRLAANRDQLSISVYAGFSELGNDMFGKGYEGYPELPQRTYDPEKARELLKKAGFDTLSVEVVVTDGEIGQVESATVLQQSLKAAGIDLSIRQVPSGDFWSSYWMKVPLFPTWWTRKPFSVQYEQSMSVGAPYNEAQWAQPELDEKFKVARATLDTSTRNKMYEEINKAHYEEGGYLIANWSNPLDLTSDKVNGIHPTGPNALGDFRFRMIWKSS
jgi:peptide/nickel transport system substrate-binding protein